MRQNKNKQNHQNQTKSTVAITVRAAPVSAAPQIRRTNSPKMAGMANGHTRVTNSTIVPITMDKVNTAKTFTSDVTVGNSTVFPILGSLSKNFDKVKWHKLSLEWVPSVPTTTGGNIAMYFDTDRTDVGATTISQALQNAKCVISPCWQKTRFNLNRSMLRTTEWFTTDTDPVTASPAPQTNNTFASPGRFHLLVTPLLGVTIAADATVIGYVKADYVVELGFPSGLSATTAPPALLSRRTRQLPRATDFIIYDSRHVSAWQNFSAGCLRPSNFYEYIGLLTSSGGVNWDLAMAYGPDEQSFETVSYFQTDPVTEMVPLMGKVADTVTAWREVCLPSDLDDSLVGDTEGSDVTDD